MNDFMKNIDAELRRKAEDSDRDHSYLHPSAFGGCPVEIWMKAMGIEPDVSTQTAQNIRVFDEGIMNVRWTWANTTTNSTNYR